MIELALVLAVPFASSLLLALFGHRHCAAHINSAGSLATLLAAAALTARVISDGPLEVLGGSSSSIRSTSS